MREMLSVKERSMVTAKNLGYTLPTGEVLFDGIELSVNKGDRIALVGKNGVGKSTLMKILAGKIRPTSGTVDYGAVSYVDQLDEAADERGEISLMDYLTSVSEEWWLVQIHYEKMFGGDFPSLSEQLKHLSGGEYMRLKLAIATYKDPEILLLDEPTNHLDVASKRVLKNFVKQFQGGIVIVSHDVHFVNQIAHEVWELADHKLAKFGGNYQDYLEAKRIEDESRQRKLAEAKKELSRSERALIKEQKRAARSRREGKRLAGDRSMSTIEKGYFKNRASASGGKRGEDIKIDIEDAKRKIEERSGTKRRLARLDLVETEGKKGKRLTAVRDGVLSVGDKKLVGGIELLIKYGDRVVLTGENGTGKTSLIRSLVGNADQSIRLSGIEIFRAPGLSSMYISQRYDQVDRKKTLLENVLQANPGIDTQTARRALGNLLFKEKHEVEKLAEGLSGGETARLAIAMASVSPVDLLVLDEPTNNLDVETIGIIIEALEQFKGSLLIISHDINFLNQIGINKAFRLTKGNFVEMKHLPGEENFYEELLT